MATIVDYELFEVPPRWLFVRLETDDGLVGWGEPTLEGHAEMVKAAVDKLVKTHIIGYDAGRIQDHWQAMYRSGFYRGGPILMSAISGIDQALWDIKGKECGKPVYELLGGPVRDRLRAYRWIGGDLQQGSDRLDSELETAARESVEAGFSAVKIAGSPKLRHIDAPSKIDEIVDRLAYVREVVGTDVDIGVDLHGRATRPMATRLIKAFEPYSPMFVEEPVLPEHNHVLPELASGTTVPIATGERLYSRAEFRSLLVDGGVDIIQPSIAQLGGISETKRIIDMAETFGVGAAIDCPFGPVAVAASLQIGFASWNILTQQQSLERYPEEEADIRYLENQDALRCVDGYFEPPTAPGLGIEIDEELVREQSAVDVKWNTPIRRRDDGSIAEW
ncbi:galactonate dehydratase (plasmid) [Haloarcula salina]|uniref:galactonate dehydratase n=1 Tax=Haloarcula salina TaxID=1429914 RepID=UPI003C70146E